MSAKISSGRIRSLDRPHTSPAPRRLSVRHAVDKEEATPGEGHDIELLEYEWPDLPPIPSFKEAITRQSVSRGISYLLPVDTSRNSILHQFRTDLRAMFQEPYASADRGYNDARDTLSRKVHFRSNTFDNSWTRRHADNLTYELNSECEKYRKLYSQSAPSGPASNRMGISAASLRKRSNLFIPIKARIPPEAMKMRQEAERLAKSVQEDRDEEFVGQVDQVDNNEESSANTQTAAVLDRRRLLRRDTIVPTTTNPRLKRFQSYEDFKQAHASKSKIPGWLRSPFLTDDRNQYVWEWLHRDEESNEFQHFLAMCS